MSNSGELNLIINDHSNKYGDARRREYNWGIDFLRIVSMFMVVCLHLLGRGGVLDSASFLSGKYEVLWLIEIAAYCAVNCYALISGYVGIYGKYRYTNWILLWLRVLCYSVGITAVFVSFFLEQLEDTNGNVHFFQRLWNSTGILRHIQVCLF